MNEATWTWDPDKAAANKRKHGLSFEAAARALADPQAVTEPDWHSDGDRYRTLCRFGVVVIVVIHTLSDDGGGRIISARKAARAERRPYDKRP